MASPLLVAIPELFRKEGPIEHLTHVVLALGLYYWIQKIWRGGMSAKVVAFAALHLFFLGEEVDWGQVYFPFEPPQFFLDLSPRNDP